MSIGRNDPCPCGSGKKYKKCCLEKDNLIELTQIRRKKFYDDKQQLVEKVGQFLKKQVPLHQYNQLKKELIKRTDDHIEKDLEESFFTYWLYFYYKFENNQRGIEWFYAENKHGLTVEEQSMVETWIEMKPRFLQAIDVNDEIVTYQDMLTKETFPLSNDEENIEHLVPWASTIAMIEPFEDLYYFNGFRFTVEPLQVQYALEHLEDLVNETSKEQMDVMFTNYPELIATLLNKERMKQEYGREVAEHTVTFDIHDQPAVLEHLRNQEDFRIDKWLDNVKEIVWAGNWRVYHDNENYGPLQLADVFGQIVVHNGDTQLTFHTMHPNQIAELQKRFSILGQAITLTDESAEPIGNFLTKVHNVLVSMEDDMPAYFAIYAQNNIYHEIDTPISVLNDSTIRHYLKGNNEEREIAETWLKTAEFNLYKQILERFNSVDVSADFNTIRKEFNLPLSPFVTGGAQRKTELLPIQLEETSTRLLEEDIPYLEALGFTPESLDSFYIQDIIRFYREKTDGKSDATERKYRNSLFDLRALLEKTEVEQWKQCNQAFWEDIIKEQYGKYKPNYSKTERSNFISVLRTFLLWLDSIHDTDYFSDAKQYVKVD